jgi:hypothetical protein
LFDYTLDFKTIDFRGRPDLYRVGKGEQGVLLVEPYKSEILPHWRFKTVAEAKKSSACPGSTGTTRWRNPTGRPPRRPSG